MFSVNTLYTRSLFAVHSTYYSLINQNTYSESYTRPGCLIKYFNGRSNDASAGSGKSLGKSHHESSRLDSS